jgi:FkbM family methyltransferase
MLPLKINIIDIGSVGGYDLPWKNHTQSIDWSLSFEPNEHSVLAGKNLKYNCAVWNVDGEATFYVSGPNGAGSSLLKQNFDWVQENFKSICMEGRQRLNNTWIKRSQIKKEFLCPVKKLDTILEELDQSLDKHIPFHFLKSDTQSGEFFVLEGAKNYLKNDCIGLDLELFRYPLYQNLVTEDKVKSYLDDLGFYVAGWTGYRNSFASQADYLFLRKNPRSEEETKIIELIKSVYNPRGSKNLIKPMSFSHFLSKIKSRIKNKFN